MQPSLLLSKSIALLSLFLSLSRSAGADTESSSTQVDCSTFSSNILEVPNEPDLFINTIIDPIEGILKAQLTYKGQEGWLSLAFTDGSSSMVGAEAVIGLPGQDPQKYSLSGESNAGVLPMSANRQTLIDSSITQNTTHTVLTFTKLLIEAGEHSISAISEGVFLWAVGSGNGFGRHARRNSLQFRPAQCAVIVGGVLQNGEFVGQVGGSTSMSMDDYRSLWVAHGACAATAWAILVPLAIGASIIRRLLESFGLPPGIWFQLHRALNTIAFLLTAVSFAIAVYVFHIEDEINFKELPHHTLGLVIFIITFLQALGGMIRPHLPVKVVANAEKAEDPEDKPVDAPMKSAHEQKSTQRVLWEYGHRTVGVAVLAMAWWEVQDGLDLFAENFSQTSQKNAFWGVVGGIVGVIALLFVYQVFVVKKRDKKEEEAEEEGVKMDVGRGPFEGENVLPERAT